MFRVIYDMKAMQCAIFFQRLLNDAIISERVQFVCATEIHNKKIICQ